MSAIPATCTERVSIMPLHLVSRYGREHGSQNWESTLDAGAVGHLPIVAHINIAGGDGNPQYDELQADRNIKRLTGRCVIGAMCALGPQDVQQNALCRLKRTLSRSRSRHGSEAPGRGCPGRLHVTDQGYHPSSVDMVAQAPAYPVHRSSAIRTVAARFRGYL